MKWRVARKAERMLGIRFQFSTRRFMGVTAAIACLMVPVAWVARERQQTMRAREAILEAREVALRSVVREQQKSRIEKADLDRLQRENADLKKEIEELRRWVEELGGLNIPAGAARQ
jgi:hypothetical protein